MNFGVILTNASTNLEPLALTAIQAAKLLGVSRSHFFKLASSGRLPLPVRLGRAVRWRRDELVEWLEAGCPTLDKWQMMRSNHAQRG